MIKKDKLVIDSTAGGNGDIWMRLVGFYTIAGMLPQLEIRILIPKFLRALAQHTFGDRLVILQDTNEKIRLRYTSLGMRDLVKGFAQGYRYIQPYQRTVANDKKARELKDNLNILLFNCANFFGLVHLPDWKWLPNYQGYTDIIGLGIFKKISYDAFVEQLKADVDSTLTRLQKNVPSSPQLQIPRDLNQSLLVFPTGTSRQFIPTWWAKENLPDAYFAFFYKDKEAVEYKRSGLKTLYFYQEPGDIIKLSHNALWTISTDSFPSHLLQSSCKNCTITLTEVTKSRIISPVFRGKIVNSEAACHPCLHLDRKNHPKCAAGYTECINWKNKIYSKNILNTISSEVIDA
jgi:hypothetical protein